MSLGFVEGSFLPYALADGNSHPQCKNKHCRKNPCGFWYFQERFQIPEEFREL